MADRRTSRRSFLQLGGAGAASLFCTIGGERVDLSKPGAAGRADAAAARVTRPPAARDLPAKLALRPRTRIVWRWPAEAGDVHDVKLGSAPKGVRKFHSRPASAGYTFKRTLEKPGRYRIVCTLHEEMRMTITVRR